MVAIGAAVRRMGRLAGFGFGVAGVLAMVACGADDEAASSATGAAASSPAADGSGNPPLPPPALEPDNDAVNAALVGMTAAAAEAAATEAGYVVRIAMVDGEPRALTMDYRTDRINLELEDDVVVRAFAG